MHDRTLDIYNLTKYRRSNQNTCLNQKPIVKKGQRVEEGRGDRRRPGHRQGELALGRNVLVAFMPWDGYNFEDAIIISERLVKDDSYTSIHIEEFEIEIRETKLGKEEITRDIPNVAEEALQGPRREGHRADRRRGQGRATSWSARSRRRARRADARGEAAARDLRQKAGDVRDTSLRCPPGIEGTVIDVQRVLAARHRQGRARQVHREAKRSTGWRRISRTRSRSSRWSATRSSRTCCVGKSLTNDLDDGTGSDARPRRARTIDARMARRAARLGRS